MKEYRRILLVDDNKDIHEDFHKILNTPEQAHTEINALEGILFEHGKTTEEHHFHYRLDDAYQGDEALIMVARAEKEEDPYVLIFMDVRMPPGMDGIETIYRIWRKYPMIEIVICSAYSDYSWDEIVEKFGVTDKLLFLKKPFNSTELKQIAFSLVKKWNLNCRINLQVKNLEEEVKIRTRQLDKMLVELREKNRKLEEISRQDSLTGLLNHAALCEQLDALHSESRRHEYPLALIMVDIDHFRDLNERCGHAAGDEILQKVSQSISGTLRLYDITLRYRDDGSELLKKEIERFGLAGRYGGDEFILMIPHCGREGAVSVTERIRMKIQVLHPDDFPEVKLSASIGVAILEKDVHCPDSEALIKLADKALSSSRSRGVNQISYSVTNNCGLPAATKAIKS